MLRMQFMVSILIPTDSEARVPNLTNVARSIFQAVDLTQVNGSVEEVSPCQITLYPELEEQCSEANRASHPSQQSPTTEKEETHSDPSVREDP